MKRAVLLLLGISMVLLLAGCGLLPAALHYQISESLQHAAQTPAPTLPPLPTPSPTPEKTPEPMPTLFENWSQVPDWPERTPKPTQPPGPSATPQPAMSEFTSPDGDVSIMLPTGWVQMGPWEFLPIDYEFAFRQPVLVNGMCVARQKKKSGGVKRLINNRVKPVLKVMYPGVKMTETQAAFENESGILLEGDITHENKNCRMMIFGTDAAEMSYMLFVIAEKAWLAENQTLIDDMLNSFDVIKP